MVDPKYILGLVVFTILILFMFTNQSNNKPPHIHTMWVINLDKDTERLEGLMKQQPLLPVEIRRWSATYGKEEERSQVSKEGVHEILSRSTDVEANKKSTKVLQRAGEIGCYLSHKRLLTYLSKRPYPPDYGHLICEDDIIIDKQFKAKWNSLKKRIPSDWDFIYFGCGQPHGDKISDGILRWKNDIHAGNFGTFAYLVRQRAIPKILEALHLMGAPIDVQYYRMLRNTNVYILEPSLIRATFDYESSINQQEQRE